MSHALAFSINPILQASLFSSYFLYYELDFLNPQSCPQYFRVACSGPCQIDADYLLGNKESWTLCAKLQTGYGALKQTKIEFLIDTGCLGFDVSLGQLHALCWLFMPFGWRLQCTFLLASHVHGMRSLTTVCC